VLFTGNRSVTTKRTTFFKKNKDFFGQTGEARPDLAS
jgi:hypothetical protein